MHDLGFFRANFEKIAQRLSTRGAISGLDQFRELDKRRRAAITEAEELKARRNTESAEIAELRKAGRRHRRAAAAGARHRRAWLGAGRAGQDGWTKSSAALAAGIPNLPHESVPVGRGAEDNVEVRRWGEPPRFDFEPKAHWDLGPELGILDLERAAKITGARFAVYWGRAPSSSAR